MYIWWKCVRMSTHVENDERRAFVKFQWSWESIYGNWKWCTCTLMYFCQAARRQKRLHPLFASLETALRQAQASTRSLATKGNWTDACVALARRIFSYFLCTRAPYNKSWWKIVWIPWIVLIIFIDLAWYVSYDIGYL